MDSGIAHKLYQKYAGVMAYVSVVDPNGTPHIGSAFHVGEGVFVTARHVVEGMTIVEVAMTEHSYIPLEGEEALRTRDFLRIGGEDVPVHYVNNGVLTLVSGPHYHSNPAVDVAVFKVSPIDEHTPYVVLGDHLDDWIGASDFLLAEAIIFGYPPIPFTRKPYLVAARAEVNATIDLRDAPHVHFVLSSMPRGGFSGGLALLEYEFVLGVITRSLLANHQTTELGFFTVLSVEPIYTCLDDSKLLPKTQWDGEM